ncbi:MAG: sigma-E processing peptidase SpoIIGA [Firmicutes bacterium]|nr:sigma-E processing peptidase SpoIIGA [Bacillota bacterium]
MPRVVYGDVLFAVNFIMNALILWGTSRFTGTAAPAARIASASAIGAAYALAAVWLQAAWMESVWAKVLVVLVMVRVVFQVRGAGQVLRLTGYAVSFSFMVAGATMAVWATTAGPGAWAHPVKWWALGAAAMLAAGGARSVAGLFRRRYALGGGCMSVEIGLCGAITGVTALLDTGNHLEDPITGAPVLVAEYEAVKGIIPADARQAVASGDPEAVAAAVAGTPSPAFSSRFRVLPFSALGEAGGLMVGFRPDSLVIEHGGRRYDRSGAVVAVCRGPLSPDGSYQALLHPGMMEGILEPG